MGEKMKATIHTIALARQQWLIVASLDLVANGTPKNLFIKLLANDSSLKTIPKQKNDVLIHVDDTEKILVCWKVLLLKNHATRVAISIKPEGEEEKRVSTVIG
ncbi:MAG: hypothetical protein ACFFB3_02925 [Candidatus Hodarchaeota archaeon]